MGNINWNSHHHARQVEDYEFLIEQGVSEDQARERSGLPKDSQLARERRAAAK